MIGYHVHGIVQIGTLARLVLLGLESLTQVHILRLIGQLVTLFQDGIIRTFCHHTLNIQVSDIDRQLTKKLEPATGPLIIVLLVASWKAQRQIADRGSRVLCYHDRLGLATRSST